MKIEELLLQPYTFTLTNGEIRSGMHIHLMNEMGEMSVGDIAPLSGWSKETLDEAAQEITQKQPDIVATNWTLETWVEDLARLKLLPSVSFGLESALLALLDPLPSYILRGGEFFRFERVKASGIEDREEGHISQYGPLRDFQSPRL